MNPRVYQAADDRWLVFHNEIKSDYFTLESEAQDMATKLTWAGQAQAQATTLAQIGDQLANLETVYFDRGYDGGGSNPITNDDVVSLNITAADLAALITLIQQLNNFLGNSAVTTGDYDATLNTVRTDV
jgi:23S rRNA maturation mini-RNase III